MAAYKLTGTITEDPNARMQWVYYWRNIVQRYQVKIEGWPEKFPFKNLSEFSSSITDLEDFLRKWRAGKIYWHKLSDEEFIKLDTERDHDIEAGKINPPTRRRRSDLGKKRPRDGHKGDSRQGPSKKHRSRSVIDTDTDSDGVEA